MPSEPAKTPLYGWHCSRQARIVEFAGWSMPVYYSSIVEEHRATRQAVGVFDISHMGRLRFNGPDAARVLDRLLTRRVLGMATGKIRYALVTNEQGGILDDVLVYNLSSTERPSHYLLVVNAGNRAKIVEWVRGHLASQDQVEFQDSSSDSAMIAVQGPYALDVCQQLLDFDPGTLEYYTGREVVIAGQPGVVSRTGYTGEDGCELIVPAGAAATIWERLVSLAEEKNGCPVGLGARDTLRLEAAMPLYGHELAEAIDPFQAGLSFAVNLKDREFVGSAALSRIAADPTRLPRRVGLTLAGKRIPREKYPVLSGGQVVGEVTSGTFSPTLEQAIAMAYVRPELAPVGTELEIDIRGRPEPARVVPLPFYSRTAK